MLYLKLQERRRFCANASIRCGGGFIFGGERKECQRADETIKFISMHKTTAARWKTPNFHQCGEKDKGKAKVYLVIETSGAGT